LKDITTARACIFDAIFKASYPKSSTHILEKYFEIVRPIFCSVFQKLRLGEHNMTSKDDQVAQARSVNHQSTRKRSAICSNVSTVFPIRHLAINEDFVRPIQHFGTCFQSTFQCFVAQMDYSTVAVKGSHENRFKSPMSPDGRTHAWDRRPAIRTPVHGVYPTNASSRILRRCIARDSHRLDRVESTPWHGAVGNQSLDVARMSSVSVSERCANIARHSIAPLQHRLARPVLVVRSVRVANLGRLDAHMAIVFVGLCSIERRFWKDRTKDRS
jgi:hypothetical protein